MAVEQENTYIAYAGNIGGTGYAFPYYFRSFSDLIVTLVDASMDVTSLVLNTDFTVAGTVDPQLNVYSNGGTVTLNNTAVGFTVLIMRRSQKTQAAVYNPEDPFPAKTHEAALDALALRLQELDVHFQGYADGYPTAGAYVVDDWFYVRNAAAFGFHKIICSVAGTPGTWKPFCPIGA